MGKKHSDVLFTISQAGQSYPLKIKKSKFITSACHVKTEYEAKEFIERIKKQHNKATHNAYAYRISLDGGILIDSDDDGEPGSTAGGSILFVLEQQNLANLVVIVTRYYGGVKLGKGGLVRAYSTSTSELIKHLGIQKLKTVDR